MCSAGWALPRRRCAHRAHRGERQRERETERETTHARARAHTHTQREMVSKFPQAKAKHDNLNDLYILSTCSPPPLLLPSSPPLSVVYATTPSARSLPLLLDRGSDEYR